MTCRIFNLASLRSAIAVISGSSTAKCFVLAAALISFPSCAGLMTQTDPLNHPGILCRVNYLQLDPDTLVGYDGCGNVWKKDVLTDKCQILSADGTHMIDLPRCPAQGDTLTSFPRNQ